MLYYLILANYLNSTYCIHKTHPMNANEIVSFNLNIIMWVLKTTKNM